MISLIHGLYVIVLLASCAPLYASDDLASYLSDSERAELRQKVTAMSPDLSAAETLMLKGSCIDQKLVERCLMARMDDTGNSRETYANILILSRNPAIRESASLALADPDKFWDARLPKQRAQLRADTKKGNRQSAIRLMTYGDDADQQLAYPVLYKTFRDEKAAGFIVFANEYAMALMRSRNPEVKNLVRSFILAHLRKIATEFGADNVFVSSIIETLRNYSHIHRDVLIAHTWLKERGSRAETLQQLLSGEE